MYTGMALTGLGALTFTGGGVYFIVDGYFISGYGAVFIGIPMMLGGAIFAGVGIPLWVSGARAPTQALRSPLIPTVSVGPRSVSARWQF